MAVREEAWRLIGAIERDRDRRDGDDPGPGAVSVRVDLWAPTMRARVETMIRRARRLNALYERACSDSRADADAIGAAIVRAEARIANDVRKLAPGCSVVFQPDPRGAPVRILFPERRRGGDVFPSWEHPFGLR